jgi:hypothetical protein
MHIDMNTLETALFDACTTLVLGDGRTTSFWEGRWLQGNKPKVLAPALLRLALRKNQTVAQGLEAGKWMRGLQRITTTEELDQFITLWSMVAQVQLSDEPDKVLWRLSASAKYTSKSAYWAQFLGSYADYDWKRIWKSNVEPKCRFFAWLLLHHKLWTADRIIRHGGQANPICQLCKTQPETMLHIMSECSYSRLVWQQLEEWTDATNVHMQPGTDRRVKVWWTELQNGDTTGFASRLQRVIYTAWNLWKERCRRVYDSKAITEAQLESIIKLDVTQFNNAWHSIQHSENSTPHS